MLYIYTGESCEGLEGVTAEGLGGMAALGEAALAMGAMVVPRGNPSKRNDVDMLAGAPVEDAGSLEEVKKGVGADKFKAQLAMATAIIPSCTHWNVKDIDFPKEKKLGAAAMRAEMSCRDPTCRPTIWGVHKLCKWLHEHTSNEKSSKKARLALTCIGHDAFNLILKELSLANTRLTSNMTALARVCKSMVANIAACLSGWMDHCAGMYSMKLTSLATRNSWIQSRENTENVRRRHAANERLYPQ
jgi:hypothetical protein